jgi:hypothetical protein
MTSDVDAATAITGADNTAEPSSESAEASNATLRSIGGRLRPTAMTGSFIDLSPIIIVMAWYVASLGA